MDLSAKVASSFGDPAAFAEAESSVKAFEDLVARLLKAVEALESLGPRVAALKATAPPG